MPLARTRIATVPVVAFVTGISTLAEAPSGRSIVTTGAAARLEVTERAGMGRDIVLPCAFVIVVSGSLTDTDVLPFLSTVATEEAPLGAVVVMVLLPSGLVTVVVVEPSGLVTVSVVVPEPVEGTSGFSGA